MLLKREGNNMKSISFGSQMGDTRSADIVQPQLIYLRKLLNQYCTSAYTVEGFEFAPILRVDGDIWVFNFVGVDKVRINKKDKYVSADIGMPREIWVRGDALGIRTFIIINLIASIDAMVNRLQMHGITVNSV